jgi:hypothetical protein
MENPTVADRRKPVDVRRGEILLNKNLSRLSKAPFLIGTALFLLSGFLVFQPQTRKETPP